MTDLNEVGNVLDDLRELQESVGNVNNKEQFIDLRSFVVDMKEEIINLREENRVLKEEARRVIEQQGFLDSLIEVDGYLYDKDEEFRPVGYPYCPICLRVEHGPFKMLRISQQVSVCPNCKQKFRAGADGKTSKRTPEAKNKRVTACSTC